jgi:ClpP class serine protease
MVDRLYGQFVKDVAQSRRISQKAVRETEAALLNPDQASANGMIDGVETLDGALTRLNVLMSDPKKRRSYGRAAAIAQLPEEHDMSTAANGAAPVPAVITQEQLDAAKAAGVAEGKASATADAKTAKDAERARIAAITGHAEATGREKLAAHFAHNTEMSVEDAGKALAAAPKEAATQPTNLLAAAMGKIENPKVGADAGEGEAKKVTPPVAAEIYAFRRECVAKARNGKAA